MTTSSATTGPGASTDAPGPGVPPAGHAILTIDTAGTVTSWNDRARLLFAIGPDEVPKQAEDMFGPPVGVPGGVRMLLDGFAAAPGQPAAWTGNLACARGPGRPFIVTATAAREPAGSDRGGGLILICSPPPARNVAFPAVGWLPPDLSRRIGHELRGSFTGIAGLAAIMARTAATGPGDQLRRLRTIEQNARAGITTVDQVVDLSQLESGRIRCDKVTVEIEQIFAAAIGRCAAIAGPAQRVFSEGSAGVTVDTDPALLKPILVELITNALIAGAATDVRLSIVPGPDTILVQVTDDGRGVPFDEQPTIFDPFVRGVSAADGATGLGLQLARRRAQMIGAELSLLSNPGYGSTFTLSLPLGGTPGAAPTPPARTLGSGN